MTETLKRYRGSQNQYTDIGARGDERIGMNAEYAVHPAGVGILVLRFVAHNDSGQFQNFDVFEPRGNYGEFVAEEPPTGKFMAMRLNKFGIPVFQPAVPPNQAADHFTKHQLWEKVSKWISAQLLAEGFETVGDIEAVLKTSLLAPLPEGTSVKVVLQFPDMLDMKQVLQKAKNEMAKHQHDEDLDGDEDDEDNDKGGWKM